VKERSAARSAGCLEARCRDANDAHAGGHIRRQVVLTDKGRSRKVSKIERLDLRRRSARVLERLLPSFDGERAKIAIRESAESSFSDTDNGNLSHTLQDSVVRAYLALADARETYITTPNASPIFKFWFAPPEPRVWQSTQAWLVARSGRTQTLQPCFSTA
jgi:hypothetical protein